MEAARGSEGGADRRNRRRNPTGRGTQQARQAIARLREPEDCQGRQGRNGVLSRRGRVPPEEIAQIGDSRIVQVVDEARKYRAMHGAPTSGARQKINKALAGKSIHAQADILAKLL